MGNWREHGLSTRPRPTQIEQVAGLEACVVDRQWDKWSRRWRNEATVAGNDVLEGRVELVLRDQRDYVITDRRRQDAVGGGRSIRGDA